MTEKEVELLRQERKQIFTDAVSKKKMPKRIPLLSQVWTWKIMDSGFKLSEALYDYDKMIEAVSIHQQRYGWDSYMDLGTRNSIQMTDALGKRFYVINDETGDVNYIDKDVMKFEDYDKIINEGLFKSYFETALVSKCGYTDRETALENIGKAARERVKFSQFAKRVNSVMVNEHGVPSIAFGKPILPTEMLFCALRGIKGYSTDIRRAPETVIEALSIINEASYEQFSKMLADFKDNDTFLFPVRFVSLAHTVMNPKQYEKIYWPFYKKYIFDLADKGLGAMLFTEGAMNHLLDFYKDVPSGKFALLLEMDDIFEMKKKLPNITVAGGFPANLLATGTPEKCVEYVKKLEEELAFDGSYIFAFNKMISYPKDAKRENMMAITEYLRR